MSMLIWTASLLGAALICFKVLKPKRTMQQLRRIPKSEDEKITVTYCNTPYTLPCGKVISNRFIKAATTEGLANDGNPENRLQVLYKTLSTSGIGLIITGNVMVDRRYLERSGNVIFDDKTDMAAVKEWAKACTMQGPCIVQLNHPGRQANPLITKTLIAPSSIGINSLNPPRALDLEEIQDIIDRFGGAAKMAVAAGFDGVQIHAAHGYLLSQFLSPSANHRTDRYGGSLENRTRILLEIIEKVRSAIGPNQIVSVKLNSSDFTHGGFSHEDALQVVKMLCEQGMLDLIELSGGNYESIAMVAGPQTASTQQREGYFREFSKEASHAVSSFSNHPAIMLTGGIRSLSSIEKLLSEGEADFIGLARPFALEPSLAQDLINGKVIGASTISPAYNRNMVKMFRTVFGLGETAWYQQQNKRIGEGKEPDPDMSMIMAILRTLYEDVKEGRKRK